VVSSEQVGQELMTGMAETLGKTSGLRREAGVIGLLYASLGGIIGSGWLKGPMEAAQQAGPLSVFSWLIGGIAILLLALVYAELATMFPRSGAVVHFPQLSHGVLFSRIWSWILFLGYVSVAPVEVLATLGYMANIWPWLIYPKNHALTPAGFGFAVLMLAFFTVLNLLGIKWVMRITTVAGWWKLAVPLVTIFGLLIAAHHTANLHIQPHQMTSNFRGMFTALGTAGVIFSFLGFRQAVELAGQTSRPQRNIPVAVVGSVVIGIVIYVGLQLAFVMAISPADLAKYGWGALDHAKGFSVGAGPLAALASGIGLAWLAMLLYADAIVSPGGTGFIYATTSSRVIGAMSEDGFIHRSLQRLNRFVVLDRYVTQGTRSQRGQKWCERIWTAIATCTQQQRGVFEFLHQTISNHFAGKPTPSLLPSGP
jgi:amino acid transporter